MFYDRVLSGNRIIRNESAFIIENPSGCGRPFLRDSAHECRSWSFVHPYGPEAPARFGCRIYPPADGWRRNGEMCDKEHIYQCLSSAQLLSPLFGPPIRGCDDVSADIISEVSHYVKSFLRQ